MVHIILFGIEFTLNNCFTGQSPNCPILKTKIMIYLSEARVTREAYIHMTINDEYIYRELAHRIISDMPIYNLMKLIEFTKINPDDKDFRSKMHEYDPNEIRRLINEKLILFRASIDI
jgi:hypothetical protein